MWLPHTFFHVSNQQLFPNNVNSVSLKNAGVQRCYMGEYAMQWALDYTGPNAAQIQSRMADEHFSNCINVCLYQKVFLGIFKSLTLINNT